MTNVIITGGSGGLGSHIMRRLKALDFSVIDWSLPNIDISMPDEVALHAIDVFDKIDILINCAGVNEINYLEDTFDDKDWDRVMDTNAKGIYLVTRALLEKLRGGTVINILSNASHIPMTASIAYNASKGAAAIMTKQMARELGKTHNITVFGISPNKLRGTGMSSYIDQRVQEVRGWSKEQAREYQLAALPAGEETDPDTLAEFIVFLLSSKQRHKYLAGCDIPYGA